MDLSMLAPACSFTNFKSSCHLSGPARLPNRNDRLQAIPPLEAVAGIPSVVPRRFLNHHVFPPGGPEHEGSFSSRCTPGMIVIAAAPRRSLVKILQSPGGTATSRLLSDGDTLSGLAETIGTRCTSDQAFKITSAEDGNVETKTCYRSHFSSIGGEDHMENVLSRPLTEMNAVTEPFPRGATPVPGCARWGLVTRFTVQLSHTE